MRVVGTVPAERIQDTMTTRLEPVSDDMKTRSAAQNQAAVELIRRKVAAALGEGHEPSATIEIAEAAVSKTPSKHQQFMLKLTSSGKSLAEAQTEWHRYYTMLPDKEKNEVWKEFYAANQNTPYQKLFQKSGAAVAVQPLPSSGLAHPVAPSVSAAQSTFTVQQPAPGRPTVHAATPTAKITSTRVAPSGLKQRILNSVGLSNKLETKQHLQSVFFGLGVGAVFLFIFMFGFFNEYILAPMIQPSRKVTAAPIIVTSNVEASANPVIMVPKINIQIPIDFAVPSIDEATMQASLNGGVVHYPTTALPGQNGNGAYFGHSSQNIFNNGKYKFAFVLLRELTTGDTFQITYKGKRYIYQVFAKEIVPPSQVSVLNDTKGKQATAVLITCDPPGFSTNRLVVWGEQISPNPITNTTAEPVATAQQPTQLASKGPSAWSRFVQAIQFWKRPDQ